MAICFIVDRHSYYEVLKMLDKIWVETLGRISDLEKRMDNIEKQDPKLKPKPKPKSPNKK